MYTIHFSRFRIAALISAKFFVRFAQPVSCRAVPELRTYAMAWVAGTYVLQRVSRVSGAGQDNLIGI